MHILTFMNLLQIIKKHTIRLFKAVGYSLEGLKAAFISESAFMLEVLGSVVLITIACVLHLSLLHKSLLVGSLLLVLIVELINSAIEATIDRISLENNPLSKKAKDYGSAAVFLSLIIAILVWVAVLFN